MLAVRLGMARQHQMAPVGGRLLDGSALTPPLADLLMEGDTIGEDWRARTRGSGGSGGHQRQQAAADAGARQRPHAQSSHLKGLSEEWTLEMPTPR